jgi:PKD repeat protein
MNKSMKLNFYLISKFIHIILFILVIDQLLYSQVKYVAFEFNNGTTQGWTLNGPVNANELPIESPFTGLQWSDNTNYPNAISSDPVGDANGSIFFATPGSAISISDSTAWWIMRFYSPDLSADPDWQNAEGYSIELAETMSIELQYLYCNLYVNVYDNDQKRVRHFYSGTAQQINPGSWNGFSFNWSEISTFPTNYTLQSIQVNVWGQTGIFYNGSVFLDNVVAIPKKILTVVSPNGGENLYIGNDYNIQWTSVGAFQINLDYSTDNGSSWNPVAQNISSTNEGLTWRVPNTPSNNCLLKIYETLFPGVSDVSNSVFSISLPPSIQVTSPNGGEIWTAGTQKLITWNSTSVNNVKIEYSINSGLNWEIISSIYPAASGSYLWQIPARITSTCLVRITDISNPEITDQSDAVFRIKVPSIIVNSPNGGERWLAGTVHNITWISNEIENINIEYSTNGGSTWITVSGNLSAGTSQFSWTIPNTPSTQCLMKISDVTDPNMLDLSNSVFTIYSPAVSVTSPNGGESWEAGSTHNITWTSSLIGNVKIEYSTNAGLNWTTIISSYTAANGSYNWTIPNTPSTNCIVQISDVSNTTYSDQSNGVFTIRAPNPTISLTSPNGGESWEAGSTHNITWTSSLIGNVKIEYSTNAGLNWTTIISSYSAASGSYNWTIPNTPSTNCVVQISDASNTSYSDQSNGVFVIITPNPTLILTTPNGGEEWKVGAEQTISWASNNIEAIKIEYSTDNGNTWSIIVARVAANNLNYNWVVPNTPSTQCLVKISEALNSTISDQSDAVFTISLTAQTITAISPKTGDIWTTGNIYTIQWDQTLSELVNIELYKGNDLVLVIAAPVYAVNAPYGTLQWTVPSNLLQGNDYRIKISGSVSNNIYDFSDDFTIAKPVPVVTFSVDLNYIYPQLSVGDAVAVRGSVPPLNWSQNIILTDPEGDNTYSNNVEFDATANYGDLQYKFVIQKADGSIKWESNVGPGDSGNRVYNLNPGQNILPMAYFDNISIRIITPNGGETLVSGTQYDISWISSNITNVKIEYTINNGSNWTDIISSTPASNGKYQWLIPYLTSSNCKVRISDAVNATNYTLSASTFKISQSTPPIIVTSPKGSDSWLAGNTYTIQWQQTISEVINLELFKGAERVLIIAAPVYAVNQAYGTYQWTVPNDLLSGSDYRIKVISSVSDTIFAFSEYFSVIHSTPTADFEASPLIGLKPLIVNFTDLSKGEILGWLWKFGDGSESNQKNPQHIYDKGGIYNIELTVTGSGGSNTISRLNYITVDSLVWNVPSIVGVGDNLIISTSIPGYYNPTVKKLFYRIGGKNSYSETDFNQTNNLLQAIIPSENITGRGIEYYALLSDGVKLLTYPEEDAKTYPAFISVRLQSVIPGITFQSKKYEMISVPMNPTGKSIIDLLKDAYGEYDKTKWRVFRWDNDSSSYLEYPNLNVSLKPGIAFWLITKDGNNFTLSNVNSVDASKPYKLLLKPGWNQIGSPFAFPISWDSVRILIPSSPVGVPTDEIVQNPIGWNSNIEDVELDQRILAPWKGYWVLNKSDSSVILNIPPIESTALPKNNIREFSGINEFVLQIKAIIPSNVYDNQNFVGMLNDAKDGYDKYDILEPPSISDKINLSIIQNGKGFIQNILPVTTEGVYWDLKINSGLADNIQIEFERKSSLPEDFKIWFIDMNRLLSIPVADDKCVLKSIKNGSGYYRIIIGKEEYAKQHSEQVSLVPEDYVLYQNYPNPFNSSTKIRYQLKEKSLVNMEVYDILGRRIKVLINDDVQNPGDHYLNWDGTNSNGKIISSGIYILQIRANDFSDNKTMVLIK